MTRRTNSRVAGIAFLVYIAFGIPTLMLMGGATRGDGVVAKLANVAAHAVDVRLAMMFEIVAFLCALTLAITLYALTRDQDADLARLGMLCRAGEGILGAGALSRPLSLLWLAGAQGAAPDASVRGALGAYVLHGQGSNAGSILFAIGSTLFAWLMLRGRMIPSALAWLGVLASLAAVIGLPLNSIDVLPNAKTWFFWIPLALFEVLLAIWLIVKGAAAPTHVPAIVLEPAR